MNDSFEACQKGFRSSGHIQFLLFSQVSHNCKVGFRLLKHAILSLERFVEVAQESAIPLTLIRHRSRGCFGLFKV